MNFIQSITKYLPEAVDKYFYQESKTAILEQGSKYIDVNFQETGYIKIASMMLDGLSDYYSAQGADRPSDPQNYAAYAGNIGDGQRDGFAIGGASLEWEIYKLQYKRGKQFRIDYIENEESANVAIANLVEEFGRTKVVPEVDATRFSIIAGTTSLSLGNKVSELIAANTIVSKLNVAKEWLTEHEVPAEDVVCFVSPAVMTLIRSTTELTHVLLQADYKNGNNVTFTLPSLEGMPIIEVPSSRFFTDVVTTQNGYTTSANSKAINFLVCSKKAVLPIRKLEWSKLYGPEQAGLAGFHGYIFNFLMWHGVIVPKNKVTGVYVSTSTAAASTKVFTLGVATKAGNAQYGWVLDNYFTNPAGLRGKVVYSYTNQFTLNTNISAVGDEGTDYFTVAVGVENAALVGQTTAYFAVVADNGTIVATTGSTAVTLERHA